MKRGTSIQIEDVLANQVGEENLIEVPVATRAFYALLIVGSLIIGTILVQFLTIGVIKKDAYVARALDNVSDTKVKPAPRGIIFDRFEKALVKNEPSFNVFLLPKLLPEGPEARNLAIERIATIINVDTATLVEKLKKKDWNLSDKLFLINDVSQEQLVELTSSEGLGVRIEDGFKREHAVPFAFSQLIGYTGLVGESDLAENESLVLDDQIGRSGLEDYYDSYLRGINGKEVTFRNAKGVMQGEQVEKESKPGKSIKTFIDKEFQEYFYSRFKEGLTALGRDVGVGIAMNPENGEVLALVGTPGFETGKIAAALNDPRKPLFNRAVSGVYNPGSTIKPLVATGALTDGMIVPEKEIFSPGYIELPNPYSPDKPSRFLDWKPQGWVDVYAALARSSNVYFYEVGGGFEAQKGLGIMGLNKWWELFGLSRKTEIDLPNEKVGFLPTPDWKEKKTGQPWRIGDTYNVSIGQGDFSITPIELVNYIAAIANGGTFYRPRILDVITDGSGKEMLRSYPSTLFDIRTMIAKAVPEVQKGMRDGVQKSYGTANLLASLPFESAAKTGTAQIENNSKTNAFFVGYAPYKNPKIVILVLIENSREGSHNTIPIAKDVLLWYYNNRLKGQDK
ncbi:MAG: penicillin-binding transpeptidase domain-containing protein [Candidatus Paceibacterota bacterium]|jgi:penicillin-binding protein 2